MKVSKIFLLLVMGMFMINLVSAGILTEWDNVKGDLVIDETTSKYGKISIRDNLGLFALIDLELKKNTDTCLMNCEAQTEIVMHQRSSLVSDVKFMKLISDNEWKEVSIKDYNFYIKTGEESITVDDYENVCLERDYDYGTGTYKQKYNCVNTKVGSHQETRDIWEEYILGTEVEVGTYQLKLEGEIGKREVIDWQIITQGRLIDEWATWSSSFDANIKYVWQIEEVSGNLEDSVSDALDLVPIASPAYQQTGINVNATDLDTGDGFDAGSIQVTSTGEMTVNGWVNLDTTATMQMMGGGVDVAGEWRFQLTSTYFECTSAGDGGLGERTDARWANPIGTGAWHMLTCVFNSSGVSVYLDGDFKATGACPGTCTWSQTHATFLGSNDGTPTFDGTIDEVYIWEDSKDETFLTALYDSGAGTFYAELATTTTLNSPAHNSFFSTSDVDFNCSGASADSVLTNISLWSNATGIWEMGITNTTLDSTTNQTLLPYTFADGEYFWTCASGTSNGEILYAATNRTITIDSTAPIITINKPTTELDYGYINKAETLNWSIVETNFGSVWYNYNTTNITIDGLTNQTNFTLESFTNSNLTIYANDSAENNGNASVDWDYKLWQFSETFSSSTTEGATESFYLNVTLLSGIQPSTVNLIYNGSDFNSSNAAIITNTAGTNYTFSRSIEIPSVVATLNNSFFWEITLDDTTKINTSANLQNVIGLGIDNCTTHTNKLYNFTLVDEITQVQFNATYYNASGKMNIQLYTLDRSITIENLTFTQPGSNSYQVCLSTNLTGSAEFSLDLQLEYDADGYAQEFYHIQNATINEDSLGTNITLYDLPDAKSQEFVITYKASTFLAVADALIQIQRKYIDEGVFKTVEIPKTDVDGSTIAHLELADAIYTFVVVKNGVVLGTFENVLAVCQDIVLGNCDINLNSVISDSSTQDYTTFDDLTLTLNYNQTSRVLTSIFTVPSGTAKTMKLNATLYDNLGNTEVCSDTLTSSSGTLSCTAPISFGNGSMSVALTANGNEVGGAIIKMAQTNRDIFGTSIVFLTMFLFMTLIGVGISDNPMITGAFLLVGVLLSVGLNLVNTQAYIGTGATVLWIFIAVIMILIKGAKRT